MPIMHPDEEAPSDAIRLQLAIARSGLCSRRHAEELIRAGRVEVNGMIVAEMGAKVNPASDVIVVDGHQIRKAPSKRHTVMLNKPVGYLCAASDGHGGRLVTELVREVPARLVPVGRLDRDSAGLLLMSDDGDLIAKITHPRYGHRKEYLVEVSGSCGAEELRRLREPMEIDGYTIRPVGVRLVGRAGQLSLLRFVLGEGRNRQIRRMCAMVGLGVVSLTRVAIDGLRLGDLPVGGWRELTDKEIEALRNPRKSADPAPRQPKP